MALFGKGAPRLTLLRLGSGQASSRRDRPSRQPFGLPLGERNLTMRTFSGRAGEETGFHWMTSKRTTDRTKKARVERRVMGWSRHRPCQAVAGWMLMLARLQKCQIGHLPINLPAMCHAELRPPARYRQSGTRSDSHPCEYDSRPIPRAWRRRAAPALLRAQPSSARSAGRRADAFLI